MIEEKIKIDFAINQSVEVKGAKAKSTHPSIVGQLVIESSSKRQTKTKLMTKWSLWEFFNSYRLMRRMMGGRERVK